MASEPRGFFGWLLNVIITALSTVVKLVQQVLRKMSFMFKDWMSKATETEGGAIITLAAILAVTILGYKVAASAAWLKLKVNFDLLIADLKLRAGGILAFLRYREFHAVHRIFLIFDSKYSAMWKDFYNGFASLSEDIWFAAGNIESVMRETRLLFASAYALAGFTPDEIEAKQTTSVVTWMQKVKTRFSTYARNPGQVFIDIDKEIVGPALVDQNTAIAAWYKTLEYLETEIIQKYEELKTVRDQFGKFADAFDDNMDTNFHKNFDPFLESFDKWIEEVVDPFMLKVATAFDIVRDAIIWNEEAIERNRKHMRELGTNLIDLADEDLDAYLAETSLLQRILNSPSDILKWMIKRLNTRTSKAQIKSTIELLRTDDWNYESIPATGSPNIPITNEPPDNTGWFVGEF